MTDRDTRGRFTKAQDGAGWDVKQFTLADLPSLEWEPFAMDSKGLVWCKRYRPPTSGIIIVKPEPKADPLWKRILRFLFWQGDE